MFEALAGMQRNLLNLFFSLSGIDKCVFLSVLVFTLGEMRNVHKMTKWLLLPSCQYFLLQSASSDSYVKSIKSPLCMNWMNTHSQIIGSIMNKAMWWIFQDFYIVQKFNDGFCMSFYLHAFCAYVCPVLYQQM